MGFGDDTGLRLSISKVIVKRLGNAMKQRERWENQWYENHGDMGFHADNHRGSTAAGLVRPVDELI